MELLGRRQAQGGGVFVELEAEGFDDEVVVFALGEAGDGNGADDAGGGDVDGEAAAVSGIVSVGQRVAFGKLPALLFEKKAAGVGGAVAASHDRRFVLDPAGVVWSFCQRGVEKL